MSGQATVRVRVAVAVDQRGDWNACGWSKGAGDGAGDLKTTVPNCAPADDAEAAEAAREHVREGEVVHWLTAELPIPQPPVAVEVAAAVEPAAGEGGA